MTAIYRSPGEVAEYVATHQDARVAAQARIIDADSIRARLTQETQNRIDRIIHRESELSAYDLEAVRELGKYAI